MKDKKMNLIIKLMKEYTRNRVTTLMRKHRAGVYNKKESLIILRGIVVDVARLLDGDYLTLEEAEIVCEAIQSNIDNALEELEK